MNMKKRIRKAFQNATPDVLGSVLSHCQLEKGTVIKMKKRKTRKILEYTAAAAAVVLLFGVGAGIAGLVGSRGSNIPGSTQSSSDIPTEAKKWISQEDALRIAEEYTLNLYTTHIGEPRSTVTLDSANSVYKVEVLYSAYDHEYEINAVNGTILKTEKAPIDLTIENGYIGMIAARDIALQNYNLTLTETNSLFITTILDGNTFLYEVYIYCHGNYTYYINASTGEITKSVGSPVIGSGGDFGEFDRYLQNYAIGWREAREIALKDANASLSDLTELHYREIPSFDSNVYKIEFTAGRHSYQYIIHPNTGDVLSVAKSTANIPEPFIAHTKETARDLALEKANISADSLTFLEIGLSDCKYHIRFGYPGHSYSASINIYSRENRVNLGHLEPEVAADENISGLIGRYSAKNIALAYAKVTAYELTKLSTYYVKDNGLEYYYVYFKVSENNYTCKVNARTGNVIEFDKNGQLIYEDTSLPEGKLTTDHVVSIALKYYGKTEEEIENLKCELQRESENAYYRITFTRRTYNYEIHIDAYTGEVLKSGWVIDLEGASLEDLLWTPGTWYNMALTCEYATPADIDLYAFFYQGFDDESSELTEAEQAFMESVSGPDWIYWGADRLPAEKMNAVLQEYFGITLNETNKVKLHWFKYWEETNCYYHSHTDSRIAQIEIERVENQPDGTICVYYHRDYPEADMVVTVKPNGDGYQILSNLPVAE